MANYTYNTDTGVIVPDTQTINSDVISDFKKALGSNLDATPSTPQGRLISCETEARIKLITFCAAIANQFNPDLATGIYLDAICALSGITRAQAYSTAVIATVTGVPNTVIPANSQAKTVAGDIFYNENEITIGKNGSANANFTSLAKAAIPCNAGNLTQIVSPVLGWETITNTNAGKLGADMESDADLRTRRKASLYQGEGYLQAIKKALLATENVKSVFIYENFTNATQTIDLIEIPAHSLYIVVDGGTNEAIAHAIFDKKAPGCALIGDISINLTGLYNQTYAIKFNRPLQIPIAVNATVKNTSSLSTQTIAAQVKQAILKYAANSIQNIDGLKCGQDVSTFEIAGAINIEVPNVFVKNIQICKLGQTLSTDVVDIKINELATISPDNITVIIE